MSVIDDGIAVVGTLEGCLFILNVELYTINSYTQTFFIPRAVDAIRLRGMRIEYLLAWTSMTGDMVTGNATRRITGQEAGAITTTSHDHLGLNEALVHVKIGERPTITVQYDMGKSYLMTVEIRENDRP